MEYEKTLNVNYAGQAKDHQGAIEELDRELERFEVALDQLSKRLGPVLSQYDRTEVELAVPREEPATQLRGRTVRLQDQLSRLERIIAEVDL